MLSQTALAILQQLENVLGLQASGSIVKRRDDCDQQTKIDIGVYSQTANSTRSYHPTRDTVTRS